MYEGKRIAVVVPAYDEELLIGRVIETMPEYVDRIYVVDDCSRDATCARVESYLEQSSYKDRLELIRMQANRGVGGAINAGYQKAAEDDMEVVAVMAGDAQMDPTDLPNILGPVARGEVDYAKGNRLFTGEAWKLIPRYRYLGNAFLSLLTKIASGYWHVADSQTGYTAISADTIRLLPFGRLYNRYGYPNQLLVMLNIYSLKVRDVPIQPVYNVGEVSGIRLHQVIPRMSWLLVKSFFWRLKEKYIIRDFHPLVFFYTFGLTLFPLGVLGGVYLFLYRLIVGPVAATSALFATFIAISGLQLLLFAMWFDMESNKELR